MLKCRAAALTDAGCQRTSNRDAYFKSPDLCVFAVADGWGPSLGGQLAVEAVEQLWESSYPGKSDDAVVEWLTATVNAVNQLLIARGAEKYDKMTTIIVAARSVNDTLQIAHVGDSRAYLVRGDGTTQLTIDHSPGYEMVRAGRITEKQLAQHPLKKDAFMSYPPRVIGLHEEIKIDSISVKLLSGDWIVLCTDGLSENLDDRQITAAANQSRSPEDLCQRLVKLALDAGGADNITVVALGLE